MAIPSIRWLRRIGIALVAAITILALQWVARFWWQRLSLPWDNRLAVAIVVPAVAFVWAMWWLWWQLPRHQLHKLDVQIHDPKARADTEDNFRKTVGQALGGAAVLIAAGFGLFQFLQQQRTASEQQRTAAQQFAQQQKTASDQALAQQRAAQDLLISNQVSKGFEQLGGDKVAVRLGGIYALEGVMNTSEQYHQPVLEALCAFVRDSTRDVKIAPPNPKTGIANIPRLATDVQAALTVIGRRKPGPGDVDLLRANIPGADLSNANLGGANLSGANLFRAHLSNANMSGANLSDVDLRGAILLRTDLKGAILLGTDLTGAFLQSADLSGGIDLTHAFLSQADLMGANLRDANLSGANLAEAHLRDANLSGANLFGAILLNADLGGTTLGNAKGLTPLQLDQAFCGKPATLPPGLTLEKPCPWDTGTDLR
jgi:hypothetical protein